MSVNWLKDFIEEMPLVSRLRIEGSDLAIEAADEIERLLSLIVAWADTHDPDADGWANDAALNAEDALRKAVES